MAVNIFLVDRHFCSAAEPGLLWPVTRELIPLASICANKDALRPDPPKLKHQSALSRSVYSLLARTEYRRCVSENEFEAIGRLRYKSYTATGLAAPTGSGSILDGLDRSPNCFAFGVFVDGDLAATVRVHHVTAECPLSLAMSTFPDVLEPRLALGETFIDPTRFAVDLDLASRYRGLPYVALRVPTLASQHFDATACLSVIVGHHTGFYSRIFGSAEIGSARSCPGIESQVKLLAAACADSADVYRRYPFFKSSESERQAMFENQASS